MIPSIKFLLRCASIFVSLILVAGLAGCASSIQLASVPSVDRADANAKSAAQVTASPIISASGKDSREISPVLVAPAHVVQPGHLLRIVYFDYDNFDIKSEFSSVIEENARYLKSDVKRRLSLDGHTDERGGREYNLALGQKRADTVRRALILLGANHEQIEPVSFGEEKPVEDEPNEESYAKNRRVEFTYR